MIEYKGYSGVFEYDPEIEVFAGHVVDLRDQIYFEGSSVEELKASMARAVDHYLAVCERRGEEPDRPFSGRFNVRLPPALHRRVAKAAAMSGESMNEWVTEALQEKVAEDFEHGWNAKR
jgi:predicted HicB family RNase H-like nuclease